MYKRGDYIHRGKVFLKNKFLGGYQLSTLMFYVTDLCDSRCKHCLIWKKRPVKYLPKEQIFDIVSNSASVTPETKIGLEGGEFLLHPDAEEIMAWFRKNHPNFDILSNALKPDALIDAVKKHPPERLYISLDGTEETYHYMRGKDGYAGIMKVLDALKDVVPVSLMFCLSPYNKLDDLRHVAEVAKEKGADMRVGIYNDISFFDTVDKAHEDSVSYENEEIPAVIKEFSENYDYLVLYNEWKRGKLKLPCNSILDTAVVLPNGDIPVCMNLDETIGNINDRSLDDILADANNRQRLSHLSRNCNACFINFHRKYDIILLKNLERFFPKAALSKMFGYYQWSEDAGKSYQNILGDQ